MGPSSTARSTRAAVVPILGAAALFALCALLLLRFPPEVYPIYPVCPVWRFFHVLCPGCGTTRALACLLRGDIPGALRLNALTTVLLPLLGCVLVERKVFLARRRIFSDEQTAAALLAAALIFCAARNLL